MLINFLYLILLIILFNISSVTLHIPRFLNFEHRLYDLKYIKEDKIDPNQTCIEDKYGLEYYGIQNVTSDGTPCIKWSRNLSLYARYRLKGKNVPNNYCRNPDNDSKGPWCFVEKKVSYQRRFQFKHCGIPLCNETKKNLKMGVTMLASTRDCPYGFEPIKYKYRPNLIKFCYVKPEFVDRLPIGSYSFELFDTKDDDCFQGFTKIKVSKYKIYCSKKSKNKNTISFPTYLYPRVGSMVFMTMVLNRSNCPDMYNDTSIVIHRSIESNGPINCYYFYKLASNKIQEDKRLLFMTKMSSCPNGWTKVTLSLFTNNFKNYILNKSSMTLCQPNKDIENYPDGKYCLFSKYSTSTRRCPTDFLPVEMTVYSNNLLICCRESTGVAQLYPNSNLLNFTKFTSLFVIGPGHLCKTDEKTLSITKVAFHYMRASRYLKISCKNCDLFPFFTNSKPYNFQICMIETIKKGFAYGSSNLICPLEMQSSFIRFKFVVNRKTTLVYFRFCSVFNYPDNLKFPDGNYCVFKVGLSCPEGFESQKEGFFNYTGEIYASGEAPNYRSDSICCKSSSNKNTFSMTDKLPYVTKYMEFGLPFTKKYNECFHGLSTHTAFKSHYMCDYMPTRIKSSNYIISGLNKCRSNYMYYPTYRYPYKSKTTTKYCKYYVKKIPPPGKYCAAFQKKCSDKYFNYLTYFVLNSFIICCRKPTEDKSESTSLLSEWTDNLPTISLFPYNGSCQTFSSYNNGRTVYPTKVYYTAMDIGESHKTNLSLIGVSIRKVYGHYQIAIPECIYTMDKYNMSITWPFSNYGLPKPLAGCPPGFKSGYIQHFMETSNPSFAHSESIHWAGDYTYGGNKLKLEFCVKQKSGSYNNKLPLPYGRYCVLQVGSRCAYGFMSGYVKFVEVTVLNKQGPFFIRNGTLPDINTDGPYIIYNFCCRSGYQDPTSKPMVLPQETGPFYLFRYGPTCQSVQGMRVSDEYICIDSEDTQQYLNMTFQAPYYTSGATPITGSYVRGCDFQINMCYYERDVPKTNSSIPINSNVSWPPGQYGFIKPIKKSCPNGFEEGKIMKYKKIPLNPNFIRNMIFGHDLEHDSYILSYCNRISDNTTTEEAPWPEGKYCFFFEKLCPNGMNSYNPSLTKLFGHHLSGSKLRWTRLCCRSTEDDLNSIYFPGDHYSIILRPSHITYKCPIHKNMRVAVIYSFFFMVCHYERREEIKTQGIQFPSGTYLFPPIKSSKNYSNEIRCPPQFQLVIHQHESFKKQESREPIKLQFCQPINSTYDKNQIFPYGDYCILTIDDKCPPQFKEENMLMLKGYYFKTSQYKFSHYLACCQSAPNNHLISNYYYNSELDVDQMNDYLYLYSNAQKCSFIHNILSVVMIEMKTPLISRKFDNLSPIIKQNLDNTSQIGICMYGQQSWYKIAESHCRCHSNAICSITLSKTFCFCRMGYFGNGKVCGKLTNTTDKCGNVCDEIKSSCQYQNHTKTYKCVCKEGYQGDGYECVPSCSTRKCNAFSTCVLDTLESYCKCRDGNIETYNGKCYGDFINTIFHLPELDNLQNINITCIDESVRHYLIDPHPSKSFITLLIPPNNKVYEKCANFGNYYSVNTVKNYIQADLPWNKSVKTVSGWKILLEKDESNKWTVNKNISVKQYYQFTNALILNINSEIYSSYPTDDSNNNGASTFTYNWKSTIFITLGIVITILLIVIIIGLYIHFYRNDIFSFTKLHEARSASNIHFDPNEEKVEIE